MTFDYLMKIGLGQMGMSADDFWDLTPKEFYYKMEGFFDHQMFLQRQDWERIRWSTTVLFNIQVDPKYRVEPQKLLKFEWEKKTSAPPISQEDLEKRKDFYEHKSKR